MNADAVQAITLQLAALRAGDAGALDRVLPMIYDDLRRIAGRIQKPGTSLNPTALVHEAYARMVNAAGQVYEDRGHFMSVAALAMRQLLADQARAQRALKRGGDAERVTLRSHDAMDSGADMDLIALDEALTALSEIFPRQARVVEMRFLTGLSVEEVAEVLEVSPRTVKADWSLARAWLSRRIRGDADDLPE